MQILFYFVLVLHLIVCFFLVGVVLIQQGRSADLAGAFGGQGSHSVLEDAKPAPVSAPATPVK